MLSLFTKNTITCPHCKGQTQTPPAPKASGIDTIIQKAVCTQCKKSYDYMKCVCDSVIYSEKPLFFGGLISCKSCKKSHQIVPCPCCKMVNLWNGNYTMGAFVTCFQCKTPFQHVACGSCHQGNYWISPGNFKQGYRFGLVVDCYYCKKRFQHLNCPNCREFIYYDKLNYMQGTPQKCTSCNKGFQHVNCPDCGYANFFKNLDFHVGKPSTCGNCKASYLHANCFGCKEINASKISILPNYSNKFACFRCKRNNVLISCPLCKTPNELDPVLDSCSAVKCSSCSKSFYSCMCSKCSQIEYCLCDGRAEHKCSACGNKALKGLSAKQQKLNNFGGFVAMDSRANIKPNPEEEDEDLKKAIEESIRSQKEYEFSRKEMAMALGSLIKINDQEKQNERNSLYKFEKPAQEAKNSQQNFNEEAFSCKICFAKHVNMIFEACGHACCCEDCVNGMKKKECPLCQKPSSVKKIFFG